MNNNHGRRRTRRVRQQRKQQAKSQLSRILLTACLMALIAVVSIGGTIAWLTDASVEIKNTFTQSDITVTLEETTTDYKMVPGKPIPKDPKVTIKKGSEASYVFVKIEKSENFDDFMTYIVATGWTKLTDDGDNNELTDVYWRTQDALTADTAVDVSYYVLSGNDDNANGIVSVKDEVTKENLNALTDETKPTLTFTAYAVQQYGMSDVNAAWAQAKTLDADDVTVTP